MKIVEYRRANDIDVEFTSGYRRNSSYNNFKIGAIDHVDYRGRVGETRCNRYGSKITVTNYTNNVNVGVMFDNGYSTTTSWGNFKNANLKSPYCKTFLGVGYIGEGDFTPQDLWYKYWSSMISRVELSSEYLHRDYLGVSICEDWYNYQNFAKWASDNYYVIPNSEMRLDKDILIKGNKLYSPDTCVFVSIDLNCLFTKSDKARGNTPIGVTVRSNGKYQVRCGNSYGNVSLGYYNNKQDAFLVYKEFKESHIKNVADKYKEFMPPNLYNAMYKYEVEITD